MAFGWGDLVGKIADWFPGRVENLRNQKAKLERELNELSKKEHLTSGDVIRFTTVANKLREVETKLNNR